MKKLIPILLICLLLTACGKTEPVETTAGSTEPSAIPTETSAQAAYAVPGEAEMPANNSGVDWGLTLTAEKVKSTNCILRYTQSGGSPTGELQTGAYYCLEVYDGEWKPAANLHPDEEIAWNSIAYLIPMNGGTEMTEDWSFLHGPLLPGWYRIGKEIIDFRGPGDYDKAIFYGYFEITK